MVEAKWRIASSCTSACRQRTGQDAGGGLHVHSVQGMVPSSPAARGTRLVQGAGMPLLACPAREAHLRAQQAHGGGLCIHRDVEEHHGVLCAREGRGGG